MAWEDFFNHKCTIYHVEEGKSNLGYGIKDEHSFTYHEVPEEKDTDVRCHFHIKSGNTQIVQTEPLNDYYARIKLSLPIDTDIRPNDKIVSGETGYTYIAELPRKVQNHHIIVYIKRDKAVKGAI